MSKVKNFFKYIFNINYTFYIVLFNLVIILTVISLAVYLYKSDTVMFKAVDIFDERTQNVLNVKEKRDRMMKFIESINFFSSKLFKPIEYSEYKNLPVLDLKFNRKNINYINDVIARSLDQSKNVYSLGPFISIYDNDFIDDTKSKLFYKNQEYDVKVKLHGVGDDNWINPKKSYSIKTSKEKLFKNIRRFKLIVLEEQSIQTLFSYHLSNFMGYFKVNTEIVRLRINGIDQGLYLFEETLSKEILEKNNLPGVDIIKALDEWTHQYNTGHLTLFTHELANQNFDNISGKDLGQLLLFKKLIFAENFKEIENLVDLEKFALFEAMRIIFASDQGITGDNLKMLFDTTSGKFFPYFRMEGYLLPLPKSDLSNTFDRELNEWFGSDYKIRIFPLLNRDNNFRFLRNKYLFEILSNRDNLENYYKSIFDKISPLIKVDKTNNKPSRWYINKMESSLSYLNDNFSYIEKYLNYSRVYTTLNLIQSNELILEIVPDSNSALAMSSFDFGFSNQDIPVKILNLNDINSQYSKITTIQKYFSNKFFSLSLDDNLEIKKSTYKFKIKFINENLIQQLDENKLQVEYKNLVTNKLVPKKENYFTFIKKPNKLNLQSNYEKNLLTNLIAKYPNLKIFDNRLVFTKGFYEINEDIILPFGIDIHIESGVHLSLHPNISILGRSNLNIDGANETVFIKNVKESKPFGVIAVVGNNKTEVNIVGLDIQGGSEDNISGIFLSGALSLYHHKKIKISSSVIHNNFADDGINIKHSNIELNHNIFKSNFADAIDLDYCDGFLKNNKFNAKISVLDKDINKNGDGLDLSGSSVLIKNNIFTHFLDKAISIGEKSNAIISDNVFESNRSAITLKDGSKGYLISNIYDKNEYNIEMYQKKLIFDHPKAYIANNKISNKLIIKTPESMIYKSKDLIENFKYDIINDIEYYFKSFEKIDWIENE